MHFDIRGHNRIHFFWQRTETSVRRGMRAENQRGRHKRHLKEVSHYLLLYRFISKYWKTQLFCKNNKKMLCQFDLNKFWNERVGPRKQAASSKLRDTMAILTELLRVSRTFRPWNPNFDLGCGAARTKICWHTEWSWWSDWRAPIFVTHRDWVDSLFESNGRFQSSRRRNSSRLCCAETKDSLKSVTLKHHKNTLENCEKWR